MSRVQRSALVPYAAERMYALVLDVPAYAHRFAWCEAAQVLEAAGTVQVARLTVRVAGVRTSFTTRNLLLPSERIEIALVEGPFRRLAGVWEFVALAEQASRVALNLEFEMAGRMFGSALARGFAGVVDRMVDDFCAVARNEYAQVSL